MRRRPFDVNVPKARANASVVGLRCDAYMCVIEDDTHFSALRYMVRLIASRDQPAYTSFSVPSVRSMV
jgi:hypothetical protein